MNTPSPQHSWIAGWKAHTAAPVHPTAPLAGRAALGSVLTDLPLKSPVDRPDLSQSGLAPSSPPPAPPPSRSLWRRYLPVGLTAAIGVSCAIGVALKLADDDLAKARADLQRRTQEIAAAFDYELEQSLQMTRAGALLYSRRRPESAADFAASSRVLRSDALAVRGVNWIDLPSPAATTAASAGATLPRPRFAVGHSASDRTWALGVTDRDWQQLWPLFARSRSIQRPITAMVPGPNPLLLVVQASDRGWFLAEIDVNRSLRMTLGRMGVLDLQVFLFDRPLDYLEARLPQPSPFDPLSPLVSTVARTVANPEAVGDRFQSPVTCPWNGPWDTCTHSIGVGDRELSLLLLPTTLSLRPWSGSLLALVLGLTLTGSITAYLVRGIQQSIARDYLLGQVVSANRDLQQSQISLQERTHELEAALTHLKNAQTHLIQSEKLSSLGQLVAGIAHEINNPVSFVHGNLHHASEYVADLLDALKAYQAVIDRLTESGDLAPVIDDEMLESLQEFDLDFIAQDFPKLLTSMRVGTGRIREIVKSLRIYSHVTSEAKDPANLYESIDRVLMILQHRLLQSMPQIQLIRQDRPIPPVDCTLGQIDQVLTNLIVNAIDAIEERWATTPMQHESPQIVISTESIQDTWVKIAIADNGIGMSEATRAKLFDPFYTTKPVGKGTGLGMAIAYQIVVERHQGTIECHSIPHHGTTMTILLPVLADMD